MFLWDAWMGTKELEELKAKTANAGNGAAREQTLEPLSALLRTYVVYSFCSVPALVDMAPTILETLFAIPGLRGIAEAVVRATFFGQVGGIAFGVWGHANNVLMRCSVCRRRHCRGRTAPHRGTSEAEHWMSVRVQCRS